MIEVMVPDLRRRLAGATAVPFDVTAEHLGFDEYDLAAQGLVSHHCIVDERGMRTLTVPFRYVWPAELDLMARIAGMALEARYANWQCDPFTSESRSHVSVWRRLR